MKKDLAAFLNENEQHPLTAALRAFKHADATKAAIEAAWPFLAAKLPALSVECIPFFADRYFTLGLIYPGGHYGAIAQALKDGTFSALHCCRWCKTFFVDKDHRKDCQEQCLKERNIFRVKRWRAKLGKFAENRTLGQMLLCLKTSLSFGRITSAKHHQYGHLKARCMTWGRKLTLSQGDPRFLSMLPSFFVAAVPPTRPPPSSLSIFSLEPYFSSQKFQ